MSVLTGLICGLTMLVQVQAVDMDYDGTYNHLLVAERIQRKECPDSKHVVDWHVKISHSGEKKLAKEGEYITINADAECFSAHGVDESFKNFWVTYRVWLCNATRVERLK